MGSGAVESRRTKSANSTIAAAASPRICGEAHGYRTPPQFSASRSAIVAAIIRAAPSRSSLWRRSWRGSSFSARLEITKAARPSGTLIQKMKLQCRCSANTPPSTGPAIDAIAKTAPK